MRLFLLPSVCVALSRPASLAPDAPGSATDLLQVHGAVRVEAARVVPASKASEVAVNHSRPPVAFLGAGHARQILAAGHGPVLKLWTVAAKAHRALLQRAHDPEVHREAEKILRDPDVDFAASREAEELLDEAEVSTAAVLQTATIWFVLTALVAHFYRSGRALPVMEREVDNTKFQQWTVGLFACLEEPSLTLCACFCPAMRWAETLSYAGLLTFWAAFLIFSAGLLLDAFTAGWASLLLALVCAAYRQEIRSKFDMQQGGVTYVTDCLSYLCCFCCAIVQEARHIEAAVKAGHPACEEPT